MGSIDWMEWSRKAFDRAAREKRPVLLDISAVWCHWCHVMDDTTYADPEVSSLIARDFIPVRVDTDRRPDVNARYNMGGWPTTAFLTPEGTILTGATYLPPDEMKKVLGRVSRFYREHAGDLTEEAPIDRPGEPELPVRLKASPEPESPTRLKAAGKGKGDTDPGFDAMEAALAVARLLALAEDSFDPLHGGFGKAPKFPHVALLNLLLVAHLREPREEDRTGRSRPYLHMLEKTLRAMRERGLYDHVAGGFFRYSTTSDWEVPHYEKMLEDNAELVALYARAGRLTGTSLYREVVREVVGYLEASLRSEEGYFYGSQDADEDYYKLDAEERLARRPPKVDRTLYTGWNALAARGFLEAYLLLGDNRLRETGLAALEWTWNAARLESGLFCHYVDEKGAAGPVLLEDAAGVAHALLDAYEATGERRFLDRASRLLLQAREAFGDPAAPGFFDTAPASPGDDDFLGHTRWREKSLLANSRMCLALLRLSDIAMDPEPRRAAQVTLASFLGKHRRHGILAGDYGLALDWAAGPTAEITLTGRLAERKGQQVAFVSVRAATAARAIRWDESAADARASVCVGAACLHSLSDPAALPNAIRDAAARTGEDFEEQVFAPRPGNGAAAEAGEDAGEKTE